MMNLKLIKWLLSLTPSQLSLALLLIAVSILGVVVVNRDKKLDICITDKRDVQLYYERKFDSLALDYRRRSEAMNEELKKSLNDIIADQKQRLEEQKNINNKVKTTINNTNKVIKKATDKINTN